MISLVRPLRGLTTSRSAGKVLHPPETMVAGDRSYRLPGSNAVSNTKYNVYWNENYTASEYAFDTTRKSGVIAEALKVGAADVVLVDPGAFAERAAELIRAVHDARYVDAVMDGVPEHLAT